MPKNILNTIFLQWISSKHNYNYNYFFYYKFNREALQYTTHISISVPSVQYIQLAVSKRPGMPELSARLSALSLTLKQSE